MQAKLRLIAATALALALPASAQQGQTPAAGPATAAPATNTLGAAPEPTQSTVPASTTGAGEGELAVEEIGPDQLPTPAAPVEIPSFARRDPAIVGAIDPADAGLGADPWGGASGVFLSTLMRRMDTPLASRWAHIALRNALIARVAAPRTVDPVDWVGERVWLLLRMGEADAARLLVAGVDTDRFTPKMNQVAIQSALATADPPALCPIQDGIRKVEPGIAPLVQAMCASLAGEPESAAAQIDSARRRGRIGGIDLALAQKVVGAGADTGRAVTVEWEPVDALNAWRFGLATATGMVPPDRLMQSASPQLIAWQARAPLLTAQQRLDAARLATGLGVFSSQALLDTYALIYDATDSDELSNTDAWQLRQAFVGKDLDTKLGAMRKLWSVGSGSLQKEASRAALARAAMMIAPSRDLQTDARDLIASMLAAGYDRAAARWLGVVDDMDDANADACWAMLALAAPDGVVLDLSSGRISRFIGRDTSEGKHRSALLVASLAGLGRLDVRAAQRLNERYHLGLGKQSSWTRTIDDAAERGQAGTVLVLTGTGFQTADWAEVPAEHMYHAIAALRRTDQDFTARMVAAEALSRT